MSPRLKRDVALAFLLVLWGGSLRAQTIAIDHDPVGCVQANKFPRFFARFRPVERVARARLHFRPDGGPDWYSVPMSVEHHSYSGTLPKPEGSLRRFRYYISVTDRSLGEARTQEFAADVVSAAAGCEGQKLMAASAARVRQVLVNPPEGIADAPKVPGGFSSDGVIAGAPSPSASAASSPSPASPGSSTTSATTGATTAAGSGAAAAAVAATHAGGLGTKGLLIIGGVAAAGGGVALAASSRGGSDKPVAVTCANLTPGLTTLTVTVAQPTGTPLFSWNPVCPVASILVEETSGGSDLWSSAGNLLPPVRYGGPALSPGRSYRVILFNPNDDPLGTQTFTH